LIVVVSKVQDGHLQDGRRRRREARKPLSVGLKAASFVDRAFSCNMRAASFFSVAAHVIDQADRDVRNPNGAPTDSASARAFLSGSPMLSYWCKIAELDPSRVIDRARTLIAGCDADRRSRVGSAEVH
jgi:hypothetical protein